MTTEAPTKGREEYLQETGEVRLHDGGCVNCQQAGAEGSVAAVGIIRCCS